MRERVPREILWKDRTSMDEVLESELLSELYTVYRGMSHQTSLLFKTDDLTVMNEVGYELTWLCYHNETPYREVADQFVREVYANMGSREYAEIVISLVYAAIAVVNWTVFHVGDRVVRELKKLNTTCWCGRYATKFVRQMDREGRYFTETFLPDWDAVAAYVAEMESVRYSILEAEEDVVKMCAAEPFEPYNAETERLRRFSLDEIVEYAKNNLTLETAFPIQSMLYALLIEDGTRAEREAVASITPHIIQRSALNLNNASFQSLYGITGNQNVNLGGTDNGKEENS